MALYLKISNGAKQINGEVTNPSYLNWIDLESIQFGRSGRPIDSNTGGGTRGEGRPQFEEIVVTKYHDASSAELHQASIEGNSGPAVVAFIEITGRLGYWRETGRLELAEALVAGYAMSSTGDRPMEVITINFTSAKFIQK